MKCIFCQEDLDGSDEHIIPDSLNGRMHSKKIICHDCNSNIFGKLVDPSGKDFFNPLLLVFQFQNARGLYFYDTEGEHFVHDRQGSLKQVKPKVTKTKVGNKTKLEVKGDPKNAIKLFQKEAKKLQDEGKVNLRAEIAQPLPDGVPFKSEKVFEPVDRLKILFNKIAFEYLAYKGFDVTPYKQTLSRIKEVDDSIDNVHFCNEEFKIRNFEIKELTHLIKPIVIDGKLIVYIELFNILCAAVVIDADFNGEHDVEQYYQNSIDGSRIELNVELDENELINVVSTIAKSTNDLSLGNLIRRALRVQQEIELHNRLEEETKRPITELAEKLDKKEISQEQYDEGSMLTIIEQMAKLSIEEFPYMFDDIEDEIDNEVHYIHSNLREEHFEEFCEVNGHLIGKGIIDPEDKKFLITGFEHFPVTVKNGVSIVKVFVVVEGSSGRHRIPYREVFEMLPTNEPEE